MTFFRVALDGLSKIHNPSRWKIDHVYFSHLTVTDIKADQFHFFERINRKGLNNAGALADRLLVWNENWILVQQDNGHRIKAFDSETGIDLTLTPQKELIIQGEAGVSRKGEGLGNASHYFSYTRMKTEGKVKVRGKEYQVTGSSWMDREFSSNQLVRDQIGWDWFSLKLDNHQEIMLYQIRLKDGKIEPFSSGTLVQSSGIHEHLTLKNFQIQPSDYWTSPHTKITYPSGWNIRLPSKNIELKIEPDVGDQELHHLRSIAGAYWEGSVTIRGDIQGRPVTGKGYVELVGYGKALQTGLPDP